MASFNKVVLIGNLTRDPELRYTPNGQAVCDFSIAINRKYTVNGQEKDDVCFVDVVVWAKQAESCGKYLHKGSSVFVEGRLRNDTWEDKEGRKRSKLRVTAERVQFLTLRTGNASDFASTNNSTNDSTNDDPGFSPTDGRPSPSRQTSNTKSMPEPPKDIYSNDFETEDDIPF